VRGKSITSGLLILALAASASACVAGGNSQPTPSCSRPNTRQVCARKKPGAETTATPACRYALRSLAARCGMRSFVQFQVAGFHKFELPTPLQPAARNISLRLDSAIKGSPIGSPETDRGPPRS